MYYSLYEYQSLLVALSTTLSSQSQQLYQYQFEAYYTKKQLHKLHLLYLNIYLRYQYNDQTYLAINLALFHQKSPSQNHTRLFQQPVYTSLERSPQQLAQPITQLLELHYILPIKHLYYFLMYHKQHHLLILQQEPSQLQSKPTQSFHTKLFVVEPIQLELREFLDQLFVAIQSLPEFYKLLLAMHIALLLIQELIHYVQANQ